MYFSLNDALVKRFNDAKDESAKLEIMKEICPPTCPRGQWNLQLLLEIKNQVNATPQYKKYEGFTLPQSCMDLIEAGMALIQQAVQNSHTIKELAKQRNYGGPDAKPAGPSSSSAAGVQPSAANSTTTSTTASGARPPSP